MIGISIYIHIYIYIYTHIRIVFICVYIVVGHACIRVPQTVEGHVEQKGRVDH